MKTLVKVLRIRGGLYLGRRAVMCAMVCALLLAGSRGSAAYAQDAVGTWQGTLQAGRPLRVVFIISKADDAGFKAAMYSIDQNSPAIAGTITQQGTTIKVVVPAIGGSYEGRLSGDGNAISGTFIQRGTPLPLNLVRATPETAWTIPTPPAALPPMAPDARPTFEVASIKPSVSNRAGRLFTVRGRQVLTISTTANDLISMAYGVHPSQIIGGAEWLRTDKFDVTGQPDTPGQPNFDQLQSLVRSLLTDRFMLTFHREKRELPVYALVVGPKGPTLTKSARQEGLPSLRLDRPGVLPARSATMGDFAGVMQRVVLDRPVIDRTGLTGRFDFALIWTPDESQFGSMGGVRVPPPSATDPSAAPGLFTAIQEQLGLKFESTKAPVEVLVIDRIERPAAD